MSNKAPQIQLRLLDDVVLVLSLSWAAPRGHSWALDQARPGVYTRENLKEGVMTSTCNCAVLAHDEQPGLVREAGR